MNHHSSRRTGLFLAVSALLIAFAVLLGRAPQPPGSPRAQPPSSPVVSPTPAFALLDAARREEVRLRAAGRRFVSSFLRFEVGDLSPQVIASLRASAIPAFMRQLEAAPARRLGRQRPTSARLERLDVSFLTGSARRALLSGVARRPDGPEEFSFLFALRSGRWRALGAAE
jgi:hypothetical protein